MKKKYLQIIFSLLVTIVIFIILFRNISLKQVFYSLSQANFKIILLVLFIILVEHFFIFPTRWRLILKNVGCNLSWQEAVVIRIGSDPIIKAVPFKAGEFTRVLYLKQKKDISVNTAIFSILTEYFLNLAMLLFFIFSGVLFWIFQRKIFILDQEKPWVIFLSAKIKLFSNEWLNNAKQYFINRHINFKILFDKKILIFTFLLYFLEILAVSLILKSLNIKIPFFAIIIYLPLVILISNIPVTFFGLGARETSITFLFLQYASCDKLLASGIIYSFVGYILPMVFGLGITALFIKNIILGRSIDLNRKIK